MLCRRALCAAATLILVDAAELSADTQTPMGDRTGERSTPFTALAGSPEANLFNGSISTQIAIQVPPGRKGMTPVLALVYSSAGGPSPFGFGWTLPIGSIERTTKWGVPRCGGAHVDDFVLMMPGGVTAELVATTYGGNVYRPKVEEAFVEATAFKGSGNGNYWVVRDRAGLKYTFGRNMNGPAATADARVFKGADTFYAANPCRFTTQWMLTEIEDANGSWIRISWDKQHNFPVPAMVSYGGSKAGNGGGAQAIDHFYHVLFEYEDLPMGIGPDGTPGWTPRLVGASSYLRGVEQRVARQLARIRVHADKPNSTEIRTYEFDLILDHWNPLLKNVLVTRGGEKLQEYPDQTFTYLPAAVGGHQSEANSILVDAPTSYLRRIDSGKVTETLMDMNGDGIVDSVRAAKRWGNGSPCSTNERVWEVRLGYVDTDETFGFDDPVDWCVPLVNGGALDELRRVSSNGLDTTIDTFDITGDGVPDLIIATGPSWAVRRGDAETYLL